MHKTTSSYKGYNYTTSGACCWAGCAGDGKFPAPKSPENRNERYYFCLEHIREYNKSWNYFSKMNMDMEQIDGFQKNNLTGHRPTWKFGVNNMNFNTADEIRSRVFSEYGGDYTRPYEKTSDRDAARLPKPVRDALMALKLQYPVTLSEIKKKYKILAKEHHPDLNGNANDEKIKSINHAYSYLKTLDIFKD